MAEDNVAGWSMSRQSADRAPDITIQLNLLTISGYLKLCVLTQKQLEASNLIPSQLP